MYVCVLVCVRDFLQFFQMTLMALCNLHFIRVRTRNYLNGANEIKSINDNERSRAPQIGTTNAIIPCN